MRSLEATSSNFVKIAKVIVGLSDAYDNEETVKGCYDLNDVFKAEVRDLYIKSRMEAPERNFLIGFSRDLRDARISEIMEMRDEDKDDE